MKLSILILVTISMLLSSQTLFASDDDYDEDYNDDDYKERVYGWELMSDEEFSEHRDKMRNLETREERLEYRREHHKAMQERAKEKGLDLSDCPRRGKGPGMKSKSKSK